MPKFQQRHHVAVAEILRRDYDSLSGQDPRVSVESINIAALVIETVANNLAVMFGEDNSAFKRDVFMRTALGKDDPV